MKISVMRHIALMGCLFLAMLGVTGLLWISGNAGQQIEATVPSTDPNPDLQTDEVEPQTADMQLLEDPPFTVIITPPVVSLINLSQPDEVGWITITGSAGSVVPATVVVVTCLDTAQFTYVMADQGGSFQARLFAPSGAFVQVKHSYLPAPFDELPATYGGTGPGDIMIGWVNATAGTILQVPLPEALPGEPKPFGMAGTISGEAGEGFWTFTGTYGPEMPDGFEIYISLHGILRLVTPAIPPGFDTSSIQVVQHIGLQRLFIQDGRQLPVNQVLVSTFHTPTGFPVSRESSWTSPISQTLQITAWQQLPDLSLVAPVSITLVVPSDIQPGYYSHRVSMGFFGVPLGPETPNIMRPGFIYGGGYLPPLRIGDPAPPQLWWTLLTDTLSGGTRGSVARGDKEFIGLIPLTTYQDDTLVLPRFDPRTGQPLAYRLEPYAPLIALTDRGAPNPPVIPFKFPSGELNVTILKPDGQVTTLGPAPFQQSTSRTPAYADGKVRDNDGGAIQDVYQLTTLQDEFSYVFDQYGHHVITMTGFIADIWGNLYKGAGTFDVNVARPLDIELGELPTTPYEVGDCFLPAAHFYPPVPAQVYIRLIHLPHSDPEQAQISVIAGQANRFGYFQPSPEQSVLMTTPGEFRVDVTAVYTEPDGTLWLGTDSWGSLVEKPDSVIIAHGRRGLDVDIEPLLWFFHKILGAVEIAHTFYPYFSSDIFWGFAADPSTGYQMYGADAILPAITVQDMQGDIYQIIQERWAQAHKILLPWETLAERIELGEAPLFSTTSDGTDQLWSPHKVDQFGYAYRSSQRPGARVHETVSEEGLGIAYWRYGAPYGNQVGYEGDLPNDLKWQFGGAVFRTLSDANPINEYAIYGSLWVLVAEEDPLQGRVMPPFQGEAGTPSGGPILTLKGEEIDMLFLPMGIQPGDILEVGDVIAFSGHVGPPSFSRVSATITSPAGEEYQRTWHANKIGWLYDPDFSLVADQPGVWTVDVNVVHDEPYLPTGLVPGGHNTGSVLGSADGRYSFYVVPGGSSTLPILSPEPGYLSWPIDPQTGLPITVTQVLITGLYPTGLSDVRINYTVRMPGFILDQGVIQPEGDHFTLSIDPIALHEDFPNLDLTASEGLWPGLADPILVTLLASGNQAGESIFSARAILLNGDEVQMPEIVSKMERTIFLPLVWKDR